MVRLILLSLFLSAAGPSIPVHAQSRPDRVVIEADQDSGVVRFVIDGREVARLDAAGLHVRGDINFGGALTDYGEAGFVRHTATQEAGVDDAE